MSERSLLVRILDQAFDRQSWHGTTLAGSLRGVTPEQALWRPAADRHNIWELVLHTAYWKYVVRRRVTGEKRGNFPRSGSNWLALPQVADRSAWRADVTLLKEQHRALRTVVKGLSAAKLSARSATRKWRNSELIHGVAAHDLYHAGQIQLLKRLQRS